MLRRPEDDLAEAHSALLADPDAAAAFAEAALAEPMRCEFVDRRESVIPVGNSGTGKPQPPQDPSDD